MPRGPARRLRSTRRGLFGSIVTTPAMLSCSERMSDAVLLAALAVICDTKSSCERSQSKWKFLTVDRGGKAAAIMTALANTGVSRPPHCISLIIRSSDRHTRSDQGTTFAQGPARIWTHAPPDCLIVLVGVHRRRAYRVLEAEHRSLPQSSARHPRDHRPGARPLGRGDGALLHHPNGGRTRPDSGC